MTQDRVAPSQVTVTVASLFERSYRVFSERPAVLAVDGATMTYRQLGEQVHRLVGGLHSLGLEPGDRILLLVGNHPWFFPIDQALFVGGFVRSSLSIRLHLREVEHIANDCGARAIVADAKWAARLVEARDRIPHVEHIIVTTGTMEGTTPLDQVALAGTADPPTQLPNPQDPAALLYTSGTTGAPKGATLSHANWVAMVRNSMVELPPIHHRDVLLHVAPLSHLSGYVGPTYFARGAAHVPLAQFEPREVLDTIASQQITATALVPTMLNLLLLEAEERPADISSLRTVIYGASAIAPDRLARAIKVFGEVFVQFYGLSETPMPLTALGQRDHQFDPDGPVPERLRSAGRVNPFVDLRLVDLDGREVTPGEIGEIQVRGDTVMLGYWGQPDATREMVDSDGWAATGDLGRMDDQGYVTIVDRKNDMIVTGGYNVYPSEIENVISTLPEVQEVAVIGVPDERWGEALKAVIVVRPGHELDAEAVVGVCGENLASYKKPRSVDFVDELPKTGSGKIMRRRIRDRYWQDQERHVG